MALIQADLDAAPWVLCAGTPAVVGDKLIVVLDPEQFPDAEDIVAEIVSTEQVNSNPRGCSTTVVCTTRYTVEFDDSLLPEGIVTLQNCYVAALRCASCCDVWRRIEQLKIVLQADEVTVATYYSQLRAIEDIDIFGVGIFIDSWSSAYGEPNPITDLTANLMVSDVDGNSATSDIAGTEITLLRATPQTFEKLTLPAPIRVDAGRQIWLDVTANGGNAPALGLGLILYYRLATDS